MADLYMRDIRAWRDSTLMLSFEEKGYYDELLNLIYLYDDCLPDDDDLICRAMPVNKKVHLRLRDRLIKAKLIEIKAGYYFNKRAAQEIDKINSISSKNKIKAHKRWAKSSKNNENPITAADAANHSGDDAEDMLNLMSEGENILKKNKSKKTTLKNKRSLKHDNSAAKPKSNYVKETTDQYKKCGLERILNPDGPIPADYDEFARSQGLNQIERVFCDWANWWISENGQKAGARGWFTTWKSRVRRDVERQKLGGARKAGQYDGRLCATTVGARMALHRRRNRH